MGGAHAWPEDTPVAEVQSWPSPKSTLKTWPQEVVIISGSQNWPDVKVIWERLDELLEDTTSRGVHLIIRYGAAERGVDEFTRLWALSKTPEDCRYFTMEPIPAVWGFCQRNCKPDCQKKNKQGNWFCPRAGMVRNYKMITRGVPPVLVICFIFKGSPGTTRCLKMARDRGIKTEPYKLG